MKDRDQQAVKDRQRDGSRSAFDRLGFIQEQLVAKNELESVDVDNKSSKQTGNDGIENQREPKTDDAKVTEDNQLVSPAKGQESNDNDATNDDNMLSQEEPRGQQSHSGTNETICLREQRQKAMAQDLATAAYHAELQRKAKAKLKQTSKDGADADALSPSAYDEKEGVLGTTVVATTATINNHIENSKIKNEKDKSSNRDPPTIHTLQDILSEREKRQKEMAEDLASAAFRAELQRNNNKSNKNRFQNYKNQIESDMARVREYAAQKKVRKEVKRASDIHSNTNLLSRLTKEKKAKEAMENNSVSLRRKVKKPLSVSLSSTASKDYKQSPSLSNRSKNRHITMWDVVSKDAELKRSNKFNPPSHSNQRGNKHQRGLLLMKSKTFKTPKKPTTEDQEEGMTNSRKRKGGASGSTTLRKRSLIIAFTLVLAQRVSQIVVGQGVL